jgi:hypothetical protein
MVMILGNPPPIASSNPNHRVDARMPEHIAERLWPIVSRVIQLLVERDYIELVRLAGGTRYIVDHRPDTATD